MHRAHRNIGSDEEIGKKNDDYRPKDKGGVADTVTRSWRGPRRKRFLLAIVGLCLLYMFFKNMPTDVPTMGSRGDPRFSAGRPLRDGGIPPGASPKGPPPEEGQIEVEEGDKTQNYDGPIRFLSLAPSLSKGASYNGISPVVFAASNLKSVSNLAPLACEMASRKINNVHFLVVGREEISISALQEVNGIDEEDCPMFWHDGRPDYGRWSTDGRMEVAAKAALGHLHNFMRPKAVIVDSDYTERGWFLGAMRLKTAETQAALVELPRNSLKTMDWITRLDAVSLEAWNKVDIEILVHAPVGSSGGLIRLLRSLAAADYSGGRYPKLTIELPDAIDEPTIPFLERFNWPPKPPGRAAPESKLTLRHRLSKVYDTPDEASIRAVESFYPAHPDTSHVLVLSPQAELSPLYFHYLKFLVLKYKHSKNADVEAIQLLGISLDMPSHTLDGKTDLAIPITASEGTTSSKSSSVPSLIQWQAPNSNAALYFGDKWAEFHSFLSNRLTVERRRSKSLSSTSQKFVSEIYPAWLEYMLELTLLRSYTMLYPSFLTSSSKTSSDDDISLASIHTDLYQPPEEFTHSPPTTDNADTTPPPPPDPSTPLTHPFPLSPPPSDPPTPYTSSPLPLPPFLPLTSIPLLSLPGSPAPDRASLNKASEPFRTQFSQDGGGAGCIEGRKPDGEMRRGSADDLFCAVL